MKTAINKCLKVVAMVLGIVAATILNAQDTFTEGFFGRYGHSESGEWSKGAFE